MTLAGMQGIPFIPGTRIEGFRPGAGPTYDDVVNGRDMVRYDRFPVRIVEFHAEVFDMMHPADRSNYEGRMKELVLGIQSSECVIWKNDLQVMSTTEGQHWMRYLEWARYDVSGSPAAAKTGSTDEAAPAAGSGGSVPPKGVLQEVG